MAGRPYVAPAMLDGYQLQQSMERPHVQAHSFAKLYAAPAKPYDGLVVYADGTTWNPGAGEGLYVYHGAAWNFIA